MGLKRGPMFGFALLVSLVHCGAESWHLESSHFIVSYPPEIEGPARASLEIAEETAETLAPFFGYDFAGKKIVINVSDESDFSNGFARALQRYVGIDIRKTGPLWRGETPWLRNVIAHELSHRYTLDVLKRPIYVYTAGDLWAEEEGIEGGGSCYLEHNRLPNWFVEGLSQMGSYKFGGDRPDPYREMLLRDAYLHGRLLTLEDMARFERSSREAELVYNQGFYFLLFILDREPAQKMSRFLRAVRGNGLEKAVSMMYGASLEKLHRQWLEELAVRFSGFSAEGDGLETLCPQEAYPFVSELASTADGRYVIANWGSDYADYSLFEKRNGSYRRLADDVGTVLRQDPVSGAVWYNRLVYRARNDRERFELFELAGESGRPRQILEDTRTRAFDVYGDTVVLAVYRDGITRIEQYDMRSQERRVLYELPLGSAVYSISMNESAELLVTVGDGKRIRLFRSAGGGPVELWPEVEADILDAVYAGGGRVVFTSTIDGAPQVYAAALDGPFQSWRKLTDAAGGAMRPVVGTTERGETAIVCSVYEDGCFKLRGLAADWEAGSAPERVSASPGGFATAFPEYGDEETPLSGSLTRKRIGENLDVWERKGSPLVPATPIWTLEYGMDDDQFDGRRTFVYTLSGGALIYLSNAADTVGLGFHGGLDFFLGKGEIDGAAPFFDLLFEAEPRFGTFSQELSYQSYRYFAYEEVDRYWVNQIGLLRTATNYAFPLARYWNAELGYSYLHRHVRQTFNLKDGSVNAEVLDEPLAGSHEALIGISRSRQESTYDPAYLGRAGSLLQLSATGILNHYYAAAGVESRYDPSTALELAARVRGTLLSPGRKASLTCQLRGIGYLQAELPEDPVPPYLYLWLGRQGYATGYDSSYPYVYFAQGELDFRINPFLDPFASVKWYERFSLGVRAEGGIAYKLVSGDLKVGYPLSLELALRGGILVNPRREAYLYLKAAFPLTDKEFFETDWSRRFYFGFSL